MLRTLIVTNDFPPNVGGVERFIFALAERMPPASVHVLAPAQEGTESFDRALAFRVERLPMGRMLPSRRLRKRIAETLENERPDVVLFGHALPLGLAGPAIAKQGVPYVVLTHGREYWLAKIPGLASLFRRVAESAAGVFAISDYTARAIDRVMPDHMEVSILSPGVDANRFRPDVDGSWVRAELEAGFSPIVLCVGRLVRRKGQDKLIAALPSVRQKFPGAILVLVGDGPNRRRLERIAGHLPDGAVRLVGEIRDEDLPAFYAASDVFASPCRSRWLGLEVEGFGIVFMEASASGTPVLAGRSGGAAEAVNHRQTGLVVDGTDVDAISDGLIELLTDTRLGSRLAAAALQRARDAFDWTHTSSSLTTYLSSVVASQSRKRVGAKTRFRRDGAGM